MVEFMLALPILLFAIFGIIEFARLTFAWMAVQNAARFGIRYAVTGQFNEAGVQLPITPAIYNPVLEELKEYCIQFMEEEVQLT